MERDSKTYSNSNPRLYPIYCIFAAMFIALFAALAYRQLFLYDHYSKVGRQQSQRRIVKPGARGDIYDRKGRLIVGNRPVFSAVVYSTDVNPELIRERSRLWRAYRERGEKPSGSLTVEAMKNVLQRHMDGINGILGSSHDFDFKGFSRNFSTHRLLPTPLVENLTMTEHAVLAERLGVNSTVQLFTDSARYYPYSDYAVHAIGYVRSDFEQIDPDSPGDDLRTFSFRGKVGVSGLEKAFENTLTGRNGFEIWTVDHAGNKYELLDELSPVKGRDLISSIDMDVQGAAEEAFPQRKGAVVALDVKTGEVLAMLSRPGYDPNAVSPRIPTKLFNEIMEREGFLNRATQGLYPPGSTFKILTSVAGAGSGAITADSVSYCTGSYKVGNRVVRCHKLSGHGRVDLVSALAKSCNVFFYEHGIKMGIEPIRAAAVEFGLDSDPGIELSENFWKKTIVPGPEYKKKYREYDGPWSGGDTANTSIGQGYLRQTPLQMACFMASFAAGRTRTRPSMLHDPARRTDMAYHGAKPIGISPEMYAAIVEGMRKSVKEGTSKRADVGWVSMAAKSGTAQIFPNNRPLTLAWMVAFAPIEDPEIAVCVVVEGEEPGDAAGGKTAGPIVKEIFSEYFKDRRPAE